MQSDTDSMPHVSKYAENQLETSKLDQKIICSLCRQAYAVKIQYFSKYAKNQLKTEFLAKSTNFLGKLIQIAEF